MKKCKIIFFQSGRSDKPLTDPVIKLMKLDDIFEVIVLKIVPGSYRGAYAVAKNACMVHKPDVFYIAGDRIEAAGCCAGAFYIEPKSLIVHYEAGVTNGKISTFDDINRHIISLCSDLQLCEDATSYNVLEKIFKALYLKLNAHIVGITRHDDLQVDYSVAHTIREPYDLVLYNPPTMYDEDVLSLLKLDQDKITLWIQDNGDPTRLDYFSIVKEKYPNLVYQKTLPRPQFLGLMANCETYYTNSSNIEYEAPIFKKQEHIIQIGDRNLLRSTEFKRDSGASMRVIEVLREWWLNHER
jgi:UDP-N-acetylglucosamine 2-epimerase